MHAKYLLDRKGSACSTQVCVVVMELAFDELLTLEKTANCLVLLANLP